MNGRPLVLLTSHIPPEERDEVIAQLGDLAEVAVLPGEADPTRAERLQKAAVLLVHAWHLRPDETPLLESLRLVQSVWAGVDRIPVQALGRAHPLVQVASGSGPNAPQVAEHALGLYLDCAKRISWRDRALRDGHWTQDVVGKRIAGSRVLVVGHGHVGRRVARAFDALGASVVVVNRTGMAEEGRTAVTLAAVHERLPRVDGVVLAVPLDDATEGLVDRRFLEALPHDGILVNVARGRLIVEGDLYDHLVAHPSFQAGLDVWWRYPKRGGAFAPDAPFASLPNVVMTPHSAFQVAGARREMVAGAVANVRRFLLGEKVENIVA